MARKRRDCTSGRRRTSSGSSSCWSEVDEADAELVGDDLGDLLLADQLQIGQRAAELAAAGLLHLQRLRQLAVGDQALADQHLAEAEAARVEYGGGGTVHGLQSGVRRRCSA